MATDTEARGLATAEHHMVSAANPYAAEAGREILRAGGSAVDAAIATQLVLNLVEPQSSGIGGGAFMLYWDAAAKELKAYDGRETAPASAGPDRFLVDGQPMPFERGRALGPEHRRARSRAPPGDGPPAPRQAAVGAAVRAG